MRISLDGAIFKYGAIVDGKWADEGKFCTALQIPDDISENWINSATGHPTTHIYCNKDMAPFLLQALQNVRDRGLLHELKTFDGCLMIRSVRGEPGKPSCHSYALAIDINSDENKLNQKPKMSYALVKCFTDVGFSWGGDFHRKDGMHFSLAWE